MNLDSLATSILKLGLGLGERPVAIWFVDRPAEYYRLLAVADPNLLEPLSYPLRICGVPVRQLNQLFTTEDECASPLPSFCRTPGIWIEMSDGNHVLLEGEFWVRDLLTDLVFLEGEGRPLGFVEESE